MTSRGTAVVETAFVMSLVLMVLFGGVQLALIAFTQTSQDGAAFVAARAYAANPSAGAVSADTAAHAIFPHVPLAAFVVTPAAGQVSVTIAQTANGLPVPGSPASFGIGSIASEPFASPSGAPFAVTATLSNFYTTPGDNGAAAGLLRPRPILTAQTFGTGNGINGRFTEWYCRQGVYGGLNIPTTTAGAGSFFDPMKAASALHQIYAWDTGATCT
ncbi:MAG: hypothetical protein QOF71_1162 [Candidatus Eremiobacteraeota bacterium]|jgi:hypothetical protein|nr:hypothetical protein [Candidatus Eremiobacteraeota bacterium]